MVEELANLTDRCLSAGAACEVALGDRSRRSRRCFAGKIGQDGIRMKVSAAGCGQRELAEFLSKWGRLASGSGFAFC
jgi:hypothetical protein